MAVNLEKTRAEKAATKRAQNQRHQQRKRAQGLRRVTLWMPAEALDQAGNLERVGIVLAEDGASQSPVVLIRRKSGKLETVNYQQSMLLSGMAETHKEE